MYEFGEPIRGYCLPAVDSFYADLSLCILCGRQSVEKAEFIPSLSHDDEKLSIDDNDISYDYDVP